MLRYLVVIIIHVYIRKYKFPNFRSYQNDKSENNFSKTLVYNMFFFFWRHVHPLWHASHFSNITYKLRIRFNTEKKGYDKSSIQTRHNILHPVSTFTLFFFNIPASIMDKNVWPPTPSRWRSTKKVTPQEVTRPGWIGRDKYRYLMASPKPMPSTACCLVRIVMWYVMEQEYLFWLLLC